MPSPHRRAVHARSAFVAALALVTLAALLAGALAACGGDAAEGTYGMTKGEDVMQGFTLTLDGGEFTLAGPNPLGGEDVEFNGSYTVEGDTITLEMADEGSEVGTIVGDRLEFESIVWTRK